MIELNVSGMSCQHCVRAVTEAVQSVDAAAKVSVDLARGRVSITTAPGSSEKKIAATPASASAADFAAAILQAGYETRP